MKPDHEMTEIGDKAPAFKLYDADRKQRDLAEFLVGGHKTILAFFPGAFTGGCTRELCTFRDMFQDLQKLNGTLVGISVDSPFSQKAFAEKYGFTFPLLCDFDRRVVRDYGVVWKDLGGVSGYDSANRAIFVLSDAGVVTYKWVAPDPGVLPNFDEVKEALR